MISPFCLSSEGLPQLNVKDDLDILEETKFCGAALGAVCKAKKSSNMLYGIGTCKLNFKIN